MRQLDLIPVAPEEIFAGRPALFGLTVVNRKRWLTSYSVTIEALSASGPTRFRHVPQLEAGAERLLTWDDTLPRRKVALRRRRGGLRSR